MLYQLSYVRLSRSTIPPHLGENRRGPARPGPFVSYLLASQLEDVETVVTVAGEQ
jgi:hypothetical protein